MGKGKQIKKGKRFMLITSEDNIKTTFRSTIYRLLPSPPLPSPPLPKYNREGTETETETGTQRIKNLKNFGKLLYIFGLRKSQMHQQMLHSVLSLSKTEIWNGGRGYKYWTSLIRVHFVMKNEPLDGRTSFVKKLKASHRATSTLCFNISSAHHI